MILYKAFPSKDCKVEFLNVAVSLDNGFKIFISLDELPENLLLSIKLKFITSDKPTDDNIVLNLFFKILLLEKFDLGFAEIGIFGVILGIELRPLILAISSIKSWS